MENIAPYYKAVTGALIAFLSAIAAALAQDGISGQEWITAAIAFLVGLGAVFAIPNIPKTDTVVPELPPPTPNPASTPKAPTTRR
jgi:hypothetical protein